VWDFGCDDAERIPWFDFAHHDRFVLHGAGYAGRYQAGLDPWMHGIYSDDYIATEVLTGHPTMVSQPFGRDVVRKYWLTQDIMRQLALQTIESVEFVGGNLHRQHVVWSNGANVWVNRGTEDWLVADDSVILPAYGFLARLESENGLISASIQRRAGRIVEISSAPEHFYCNARQRIVATRQPRQFGNETRPFLDRQNPENEAIPLGAIKTAGGCRLVRDHESVVLIPLPDSGIVRTRYEIEWQQLLWNLPRPQQIIALNDEGKEIRRTRIDGSIVIESEPGVMAYRFAP
jgi:hypothetical protein